MPLVHLKGVLSDAGTKAGNSVTVLVVGSWHLRLVVVTIRFGEALDVAQRGVEPVTYLFKN